MIHKTILLSLSLAASSLAGARPDVCAYAMKKTAYLYPDLCVALDSNAGLREKWDAAYETRRTQILAGSALMGVSLVLGMVAGVNAAGNVDRCLDDALGIDDVDCDDDSPVGPFWIGGGISFLAGLGVLVAPNPGLDAALLAAKEYRRGGPPAPDTALRIAPDPPRPPQASGPVCEDIDDRILRFKCFRARRTGKAGE